MFNSKLTRQVICGDSGPVVHTTQGAVRGIIKEDTTIFRGIPYAQAQRFRAPQPVTPWEGVRNAYTFGSVCLEEHTPIARDIYYVPHYYYAQGEDCQSLNVWTKDTDAAAKRPVMVWIHGGLFETGSGIELFAYDGEELCQFGDVVVVSLNHRLNLLGYLDLSAYGAEYAVSGNAGTADIIAALVWLRDNIAAFGGDSDNITLFGQSGGGQKIAALIQSPKADGLFHKAIIQSGMSGVGRRAGVGLVKENETHNTRAAARYFAAVIVKELGLRAHTIHEIERMPYYTLAEAAQRAKAICAAQGVAVGWMPVVDGVYFVGDALTACGFREESGHIPVLIGSNLGEFSGNATHSPLPGSKNDWDEAAVMRLAQKKFGDKTEAILRAFQKAYPDHPLVDALFVDKEFRVGVLDYAQKRSRSGCADVYTYLFTLELPYMDGSLPWHNAEEAYVLHNAQYLEASYIPQVSEQLQDIMSAAWVAFARTGNPNHSSMPAWSAYDAEQQGTMMFDRVCGMTCAHDGELMALLPEKPMPSHSGKPLGGDPRQD